LSENSVKSLKVLYPIQLELSDKKFIAATHENRIIKVRYVDRDGSWHMLMGEMVVEFSVEKSKE
jgi:hypothetical protein